ncbi:unnamed protein product, partial [Schistosoma intercalatum]
MLLFQVKITSYPDDSHFKSAVNYYTSCMDSPNASIQVIENEVIKLIISQFKGWYLTTDYKKNSLIVKKNLLDDKTFSLTGLLLPLLLQSGSTSLFSLIKDDKPHIH